MRLSDALRIKGGEVAAFIDAGGISTAINQLVKEIASQIPIVVTTATGIALGQMDLAKEHLVLGSMKDLRSTFELRRDFESVLLTGEKDANETEWLGLEPDSIEKVIQMVQERGWVLLIAADSGKSTSLKLLAQSEAAIPSQCDLVVPVIGLDVIGEACNSPKVHRAKILMQLLDLDENDRIRTEHIVDLLTSSKGGLKKISPSSTVRVLLTNAESDRDMENGRQIAQGLLLDIRIQNVVLASLLEETPVRESICRVGGVILAAGESTRLDGLKQLMIFRGKPLVSHAVNTALEGGLDPVVVVVGREGEAIEKAIAQYPVRIVENPEPDRGQSSSVQLGMDTLRNQVDAVIFLLADMPLVTPECVKTLVRKHHHTLSPIIVPFSEGRRGNPVLFDRSTFDALQELKGDQGGRAIFSHYPILEIAWDNSVLFDVDTKGDIRMMKEME